MGGRSPSTQNSLRFLPPNPEKYPCDLSSELSATSEVGQKRAYGK
jgi:hypothetical protein